MSSCICKKLQFLKKNYNTERIGKYNVNRKNFKSYTERGTYKLLGHLLTHHMFFKLSRKQNQQPQTFSLNFS